MANIDPYDLEVVRAYRDVFFNNKEFGPTVLNDILNALGHYSTQIDGGISAETQLALQLQAKLILDKLGIFRFNNVDGYLQGLQQVVPRYYDKLNEEEDEFG